MSLRTPEPGSGMQATAHPNPSCGPSCEVGPSCGALRNPDTPHPRPPPCGCKTGSFHWSLGSVGLLTLDPWTGRGYRGVGGRGWR